MPFFSSWLFFALLGAFFAALTNLFGKIGVAEINSNMATWIRIIVIFAVLTPILLARKEWINPAEITRRTWVFLVLSGLATGASWLAMYRALQLGHASLVAPVDKLSVVLVILLSVAFLGESLSVRQWIGAATLVAGVAIIAWPSAEDLAKANANTPAVEPVAPNPPPHA